MNEQVAAESLAVVAEAAPAEETDGIVGALGGLAEEGVPVNRFFTGVGRNGIDPCAAGGVAVPVGIDGENFAELAGVVDFFALA